MALGDSRQAVEPGGGRGLPFPIDTMFACHTIFATCDDVRAKAALQMAAAVLHRTAVTIQDSEMWASFLNSVPVNQQLQTILQLT